MKEEKQLRKQKEKTTTNVPGDEGKSLDNSVG